MIPDHLIDKAAAAIYAASVFGDKFVYEAWHDLADDNQIKITTRIFASAALETVAAELYDMGYEAGRFDGECMSYTLPEDRPYRASEGK